MRFTPAVEVVDLCGHATLASALVVFDYLERGLTEVAFDTRSGRLIVSQQRRPAVHGLSSAQAQSHGVSRPQDLLAGLRSRPRAVLKSRDFLAVFPAEDDVRCRSILTLPCCGECRVWASSLLHWARASASTSVSRFFAPAAGVDEDPVTGSAHSTLIPYWAEQFAKPRLHALQISRRGGELWCQDRGQRVEIAGQAVLYSQGVIYL